MNEDFLDLLTALSARGARFLVVGAHAMAVHGVPRATGDLGVWVRPDAENASRVWAALTKFGAPVEALGLREKDLAKSDTVFQVGIPPRRIDVLTQLTGLEFDEARAEREAAGVSVAFLGLRELIANKEATSRPKDLADVELLKKKL